VQPEEGQTQEQVHPQIEILQYNDAYTGRILRHLGLDTRDIIATTMFLDMIFRIQDELTSNRKFNIQTNVVECAHINECECNICYESKLKPEFVKLNCGHEFCKDCIKQSLQNVRTENPQCAFCRSEIVNMELTSEDIRNEFNDIIV
jgi:hypothetical protein